MNKLEVINEYFEENDIQALTADGFDEAIIGIVDIPNTPTRVAYSVKRSIEILLKQGMDLDEAVEYFDFNVRGAYMGETTPIWVDDDLFTD